MKMDIKKNVEEIRAELESNPQYREMLFRRGYLLTNKKLTDIQGYPFYGNWKELNTGDYWLYVHSAQTVYTYMEDGVQSVLVGHAYNPFDMQCSEETICRDLIRANKSGEKAYFEKVSELTGLHVVFLITEKNVTACQDACSLTGCYFGKINDAMYITEHPQLVADLLDLKMDPMVEKLVKSKCYNIGNRHLPGNLTPYQELKRLGANTYLFYKDSFTIHRFYPTGDHPEFTTEEQQVEGIKEIGRLIHNGIECCAKKWENGAISLTGGTDSKTTLSCASGLYDKFSYFSFYSKPQEQVDAKGAAKLCDQLGLKHTVYPIPESNEEMRDFAFVKKLMQHNTNYIVNLADNEIRKFMFLRELNAYDVELKSWASEVARVFFERKYQLKMPERLHERHGSIFQTRYFGHPGLLRWSDKAYYRFLREIGLEKPLYNYEHTDLFYWEIRMGCWGVTVTSSQQVYHRVTMPMNNRKILELFLSFPHEMRKTDAVHKQVMKLMEPRVVEAEVEIQNLYFHSYRIWMEKLYFLWRTLFYRKKK